MERFGGGDADELDRLLDRAIARGMTPRTLVAWWTVENGWLEAAPCDAWRFGDRGRVLEALERLLDDAR